MTDWVKITFDTNNIAEPPRIDSASTGNPNGKYIHEVDYERIAKQGGERGVNLTRIGLKAAAAEEALDNEHYDIVAEKIKEIRDLTRHYLPVQREN